MVEDPLEGPELQSEAQQHTPPELPNDNTEANGHVHSTLQQMAEAASNIPAHPNALLNHSEEDASPDISTHPTSAIRSHDSQRETVDYPDVAANIEAPTAPLNVFAADTVIGDDVARSIVPFPDIEEDPQLGSDNALAWAIEPKSDGSFGASQQNATASIAGSEEHQIQAFAKLEFDDGEFYMNTYAVDLGRDIHAARQAFERDLKARQATESKSKKQSVSSAGGSITSPRVKQEASRNIASSVISESGGVIAVDHHETELTKKSRSRKPKSSSSSSQQLSRKSSMQFSTHKTDYNALAMASLMDHSSDLNDYDSRNPMPSPELIPLIPIHPPIVTEGGATGRKSISRKHIRIAFNFEKHLFEVEIMGRNGGFVDDEWYAPGEVLELVNRSVIQIGGVWIRFVLPDVPPGETGAEAGMNSDLLAGTMSFDMADSSDDESANSNDYGDSVNIKHEEEEEGEAEEIDMARTGAEEKKKAEPESPTPATKRKGPGRPPKNGIISKSKQAFLAKRAREEAKAVADRKAGAFTGRGKGKDVKDMKDTKYEESNVQPSGKRKYTKRKRAGGQLADKQGIRESTEHTESVPPEQAYAAPIPPKPPKEKKPPKPPRSPSPVFDESSLTPEQLAKPQSSYVVLIHEALTNSKTGAMSLPQIYRAIERRYPFYKLRVQTQGWQSSVRHNLSQHAAFRKIERDGKGWMWGLVPEVSIEKERKRRASPPPVSHQQHYYPQGPPPMQYPYPYPSMPPPNGHLPPVPYGVHPSIPGNMAHPPPRGTHGFPLPLVNAQSESTYQSPYGSTPPVQQPPSQPIPPMSEPQQVSASNGANGHYSTATPQLPRQQPVSGHQQTLEPGVRPPPSLYPQQSLASPGASGGSSNNTYGQDIVQAVAKFKSALMDTMPQTLNLETLVSSAINRTLENPSSSAAEAEDPQEKTILNALAAMLDNLSKRNMEAKHQSSDSSIIPPLKESPTPAPGDGSSSLSRAVSFAAAIAVKSALTDGDSARVEDREERRTTEGNGNGNGNGKRSLEDVDATETVQPEAKRVAIEA